MKNMIQTLTQSTSFRLAVVGLLILILLIPKVMIQSLIDERESLHEEVIEELSSLWGASQSLSGPVLSIPYREAINETEEVIRYAHFLPDELQISGELDPEIRYRSIYKMMVYQTGLEVKGSFPAPDFSSLNIPAANIMWEDAFFSIGISDLRGVANEIQFNAGGKVLSMNPGIPSSDIFESGVFARTNAKDLSDSLPFSFNIDLRGSQSLFFVPLGKTTQAKLVSSYADPGFTGSFLPVNREIGPEGFTAEWKVLHLNRNFPQQWKGKKFQPEKAAFGTELIIPAGEYQQTQRSVKYAILFVGLTFLVFFFAEVISGKKIHPVQYLMAGMALIIFYVLLLSISEHLGFNPAYLIAAVSTTGLIVFYSRTFLEKRTSSLLTGSLLILMYGFLFVLIQLTDYSLLIGSIGLFIILASIMIASGKINWYRPVE